MKIFSVLIALLAPMVFAGEKPKFTVEPLKDSVRITITGAANVEPLLIGSAAPIEFFISPSNLEGVIRVSSHKLVTLLAISATVWTYSPAFEKQTYSIPYSDLKLLGRYDRAEGKYLGGGECGVCTITRLEDVVKEQQAGDSMACQVVRGPRHLQDFAHRSRAAGGLRPPAVRAFRIHRTVDQGLRSNR